MGQRAIMILAAVQMEAAAIARALGMNCPGAGAPAQRVVEGFELSLHLIGIGARSLPDLPATRPAWVILAGFGGALDPRLQIGDLVVDGWPLAVRLPVDCQPGRVHAVDRIVATPEQKDELFGSTGASMVDMESAAVRQWAQQHGVPLIIIRAVSDRADQRLDPAVLPMVDQWGRIRPLRIAAALVKHPALLPQLVRVARCSRRAARELGEAVATAVRALANSQKCEASREDSPV